MARFVSVNPEELNVIIAEKDSPRTHKAMIIARNCFTRNLKEKH